MILVSLLFRFIEQISNKVILAPHPTTVGNTAEEILFSLIKCRKENKKLILLRPIQLPFFLRLRLTNIELFNLNSDLIYKNLIISAPLSAYLSCVYGFFRGVNILCFRAFRFNLIKKPLIPAYGANKLWEPAPPLNKGFYWGEVEKFNWKVSLKYPPNIEINVNASLVCADKLRAMGISKGDWFACLHVRESGFWGDDHSDGKSRNANIYNYLPAMEEIIARGGWVVRLGDQSMKKLPNIPKLIDYPFSEFKSDLMDLYLIKNCRFYIGMQSGILDVANLFNKPMVLTNMTGWLFNHPQKFGDIGILKHIYDSESKRFFGIEERLSMPWDSTAHTIATEKYSLVENTPDEIKDAVIEFLDEDKKYSAVQLEYVRLRKIRGRKLIFEIANSSNASSSENIQSAYRLATKLDSAEGCLCEKYLLSNWRSDAISKSSNQFPL